MPGTWNQSRAIVFVVLTGFCGAACGGGPPQSPQSEDLPEDRQLPDLTIDRLEIPAYGGPDAAVGLLRSENHARPAVDVNVNVDNVVLRDLAGDSPALLDTITAGAGTYAVGLEIRPAAGGAPIAVEYEYDGDTVALGPEESHLYQFRAWIPAVVIPGAYDLCAVVSGLEELRSDNNELCRPVRVLERGADLAITRVEQRQLCEAGVTVVGLDVFYENFGNADAAPSRLHQYTNGMEEPQSFPYGNVRPNAGEQDEPRFRTRANTPPANANPGDMVRVRFVANPDRTDGNEINWTNNEIEVEVTVLAPDPC